MLTRWQKAGESGSERIALLTDLLVKDTATVAITDARGATLSARGWVKVPVVKK